MNCPACDEKLHEYEVDRDAEFICPHCNARLLVEEGDRLGPDRLIALDNHQQESRYAY